MITGRPLRPRETVFAQAGVIPVAAINNVGPEFLPGGRVPFRMNGYVATLLAKYPPITMKHQKVQVADFHRYCSLNVVGTFRSDDTGRAGLDAAETQMRKNPGPESFVDQPIGETPVRGLIVLDRIKTLGHVLSRWDPVSRSVTNETESDHEFRDGFVVRQASLVGRSVFITTFGEGINIAGPFHAWQNGTFGPDGFWECNVIIREVLSGLSGFVF